MKRIHILLMLILALGLFSCGKNTVLTPDDTDPHDITFGTDTTLDIVTWNLELFPDNKDMSGIAQMVTAMHADIIAVQEIMDATAFSTLAASIPNYQAIIYNATSDYRLAFLYDTRTITPIEDYTIYNGESNPFPRPPYVFNFRWANKDYYVINNHLKAYGDNYIDPNDDWDDERRRQLACEMLDQYISTDLADARVIVLGDMNDQIAEPDSYNVFTSLLDKPAEYAFSDMDIALHPTNANVSYPTSNSHIDHILITNELFDDFTANGNYCRTIRAENWYGNWNTYAQVISDHRPVGIRL